MKTDVNQLRTVFAAGGIIALSVLLLNISPVVIGAAAEHRGFSNEQLGMLVVPGLMAQVAVSLILSFWVRRINWKLFVLAAGICTFIGYTFAAFATSFATLLVGLGIAGIGCGSLYAISMVCLGDATNPDRGYGFSQLIQSVLMMVGLYAVPVWISPNWGFTGILMLFAMGGVIAIVLIAYFPAAGKQTADIETQYEPEQAIENTKLSPAIMAVATLFIFTIGLNGFWVFYERIATDLGYTTESIARILSTSVLIGMVGALLPILVSDRINRNSMIIAIGLTFVLVMGGLITIVNETVFWVLSAMFQTCWVASLVYMFASIATEDRYGKIVVLVPAVYGIASAIGSVAAGFVYNYGHIVFVSFTSSMILVAIIFQVVLRIRHRATSPVVGQAQPAN